MLTGDELLARLEPYYTDAALLLLLEEIEPGRYRGVTGSLVYGFGEMLTWTPLIEESFAARDGLSRLKALAIAMTAHAARTFVAAARAGETQIPGTDYTVRFALGPHVTGFATSLGVTLDSPSDERVRLLSEPHWRRRHRSTEKRLRGESLSLERLMTVVNALPAALPCRFALLDIERRLESLGDIDELFVPPVAFDVKQRVGALEYTLVELAAIPPSAYRLAVRGANGRMLVDAQTCAIAPGQGTVALGAEFEVLGYELYRDGVLVDGYLGGFNRGMTVELGITGPPVRIALDREGNDTVEVPRGATSVETTYIGAPPPAAPLPNVEPAARAWRRELDDLDAFRERVFMSEAAQGRREGIRFLADLTRIALASSRAKQVNLVDTYGFDSHALLRIAATAARVPGGEIRLLTQNQQPPGSAVAADYDGHATVVARRLGVTIRRWTPTRAIHDRYLWIADRVWHVGHSFNQFGTDVSAVVEIRSAGVKAELITFFEAQFARSADKVYP